jgi:hypothetical protein
MAVRPILTYGCHGVHLSAKEFDHIEKFQSNNVKRIFGLPKRIHHSKLLKALGIKTRISLFNIIFKRHSPACILNTFFLSKFLTGSGCIKGTLLSAIVATGVSPLELVCGFRLPICLARDGVSAGEDGVVDSLRSLLLSGSYNIADSPERELVKLLVRAF